LSGTTQDAPINQKIQPSITRSLQHFQIPYLDFRDGTVMEKRKEKENKVKGREKLVQCQINQMRGLEKGAITDIKSQPTSNKVTTLSNPY